MRISNLLGNRFKERPNEARTESRAFLLRGGYLRTDEGGGRFWLPPGVRVRTHIIEACLRFWTRWNPQSVQLSATPPDRFSYTTEILRWLRGELSSYTQLPRMVYTVRQYAPMQGASEELLLDAWLLHHETPPASSHEEERMAEMYAILQSWGISPLLREGGTLTSEGTHSESLWAICDAGDTQIAVSEDGAYCAPLALAKVEIPSKDNGEPLAIEKVHTPATKTIEALAAFLQIPSHQTAKVVFFEQDAEGRLVMVLVRGDRAVSEEKVARLIGVSLIPATEDAIRAVGAEPGYASPVGLDVSKLRILADHTVAQSTNLVVGANEQEYHLRHFNLQRDLPQITPVDIVQAEADDETEGKHGPISVHRALKLATYEYSGTAYTQAAQMRFDTATGDAAFPFLTHYSVNIDAILVALMECRHDKFGPQWPLPIAPWSVHLHSLNRSNADVAQAADNLYDVFREIGINVLYDDRNVRPGVQFAEADLLGTPIRIIVGERNWQERKVEWKRRDYDKKGLLPYDEVLPTVQRWLTEGGSL